MQMLRGSCWPTLRQTGEDNWVISRFGSELPSVEDDVDVWCYAIVSCMPETTTTTLLSLL